ncbi:hypothetical protein GLOIN_2v1874116 [Rhizophagus irregularis DAOM 181602=DAOM 197198]|nr:hypothetical protein GLOIN_2v1874116 [Rhizophagus irregularis DAOM 181602=DAOM 197198]
MFTSINQKLEEYLLPAILKLQRDEIHQYVFYNTIQVSQEVIDKFGKYDSLPNQYLEDISDAYQITAAFASKFEAETTHIIPQHTIPFLIAIYETSQDFITQHEQLSDIQLYEDEQDKQNGNINNIELDVEDDESIPNDYIVETEFFKCETKYITDSKVCYTINWKEGHIKWNISTKSFTSVVNLFLQKINQNRSTKLSGPRLFNKENSPFILNNPNKQTKPKGRPKGTKRLKASHEKEKCTQYKCGNCGDLGHNKRNCNILR